MKRKNIFIRFLEWLLEKLGIIETYEISKEEMCKNARDICDKNCEMCAWKSEGENNWAGIDDEEAELKGETE